jgi:hypothetical protein
MIIQRRTGKFIFHCYSDIDNPDAFLKAMRKASVIPGAGRGGTGIFEWCGLTLVTRQYRHGGLFRAMTGNCFFSATRALVEAQITKYLHDENFPTVEPFCVIEEHRFLCTHLYFVTLFQENKGDLLNCLRSGSTWQRRHMVKRFAQTVRLMEQLGVYHPDLHLKNVLVAADGGLVFLDFDRAERGHIGQHDVIAMMRRLGRFVDKIEKEGRFSVTSLEKALFVRIYERMSGYKLVSAVAPSKTRMILRRWGWLMESFFYRKRVS